MSILPIAIVARAVDLEQHKHAPWELVYDEVGQIHSRRHRWGENPKWEIRRIRVDEPQDMIAGETVPFDQRGARDLEPRRRARRTEVETIASNIIREGRASVRLDRDFDLEREVLDELWHRWRMATADGFLLRALETSL